MLSPLSLTPLSPLTPLTPLSTYPASSGYTNSATSGYGGYGGFSNNYSSGYNGNALLDFPNTFLGSVLQAVISVLRGLFGYWLRL